MSSIALKEYDKYLFYFYLMVLIWAPIPLGSNRPWSSMLLVFLLAALSSAWLVLYLKEKANISSGVHRARWAILSLGCFQVWVLSQSFSFPQSLVYFLAPNISTQYQLAALGEAQYFSLNADSSLKAGIIGLGLLLNFVMALLLINTQERKRIFYTALVVSGTAQASYGVILVFVDLDILLKFEELFHAHKTTASGTFVNSNHFAGYLNICLALGISLVLTQLSYQTHETWRSFLRASIATLLSTKMHLRIYLMIMVIGLLVSQSRMGNVAFFSALTISTLFFLFRQKKFKFKMVVFFVSLLVIDIFLLGSWFGLDKVVQEVQNTNLSNNERIEINANSLSLLKEYMPMGVGAGAYKFVEPSRNVSPSVALTESAHNDYVEFLINTGLVGISCLIIFLYFIVKAIIESMRKKNHVSENEVNFSSSSAESFGLIMLLIYVAIHSLVDFNLQIPAFSFTLLACLAMAFVGNSSTNKRKSFSSVGKYDAV